MAEKELAYELNLLRKLVEINTTVTSDSRMGYAECSEMIRLTAQQLGLGTEVLDGRNVTIDGESRPNVIISLDGTSDVDLLFVTHLDVVPPMNQSGRLHPSGSGSQVTVLMDGAPPMINPTSWRL